MYLIPANPGFWSAGGTGVLYFQLAATTMEFGFYRSEDFLRNHQISHLFLLVWEELTYHITIFYFIA